MDILTNEAFWKVQPQPGFCAKLKTKTGSKVFVNFCTCDELPPPHRDLDEPALAAVLESDEPGSYRVPISLSEPRSDVDKSGNVCTVYDCIINRNYYEHRVKTGDLFRTFLLIVAMDAIEDRTKIALSRDDFSILQNKKFYGSKLMPQDIRKRPRPFIEVKEQEDAILNDSGSSQLVVDSKTLLNATSESKLPTGLRPKENNTDLQDHSRSMRDILQHVGSGVDGKTSGLEASSSNAVYKTIKPVLQNAVETVDKSVTRDSLPSSAEVKEPRYRIKQGKTSMDLSSVDILLPGVVCKKEIDLQIGTGELLLSVTGKYFLHLTDLPASLDVNSACAQLHQERSLLCVKFAMK